MSYITNGDDIVGCLMPEGNYLESCHDLDFYQYVSKTDSNVPVICVLEAVCDSGHPNLADIYNKVFIPKDTLFTKLSNKNGVLTYGRKPVNFELAITNPDVYALAMETIAHGSEDSVAFFEGSELVKNKVNQKLAELNSKFIDLPFSEKPIFLLSDKPHVFVKPSFKYETGECKKPSGSYIDSCEVTTSRYTSVDKNLTYVELCNAKFICNSLGGKIESSTVYFNINEKLSKDAAPQTVQKIENCHGKLVVGNLDNQCKGDEDKIKARASAHGKSGKFRG